MVPESHFDTDISLSRQEALLQMADLMVHHDGLEELSHKFAERLQKISPFHLIHFAFHDLSRNVMVVRTPENSHIAYVETPVEDTPWGWVWKNQKLLVVPDINHDSRFSPYIHTALNGFRSCCIFPLTTPQKTFGNSLCGQRQNQCWQRY